MKKKIFLGIIAVLLIFGATAGYAFRKEIKLVYNFLFVPPEKVEADYTSKKEELKESLLNEYEIDEMLAEGFTKEEIEKISKGEITVEEAMERILKKSEAKEEIQTQKADTEQKKVKEAEIKKAVSTATAELYRLQGIYYSKLGAIEGEIISFYNSQIASGTNKNRAKSLVISTYSGRLYAMEDEADAQVETVLRNLTNALNSFGGDTAIVSKMRAEYESQKAAKVAQYRKRIG